MKYDIIKVVTVFLIAFSFIQLSAQTKQAPGEFEPKPETLKLTQVPGEFETKAVTLEEGAYQFEIANAGVDHEVGFVLVPKGKYDAADHIKAAQSMHLQLKRQ